MSSALLRSPSAAPPSHAAQPLDQGPEPSRSDPPESESVPPPEVAKAAGLHYVNDAKPGITRAATRGGFRYVYPDGSKVTDADELARIRSLAIPPAYRDVWICPDARGHIQATGRDARGRKQYRYHLAWRAIRDEVKYERMLAFADALPRIREAADRDLELTGVPKRKVLAAIVRLLERTHIRIGNEEYTRQNKSFGLTTLRNRHVHVIGHTLRFHFRGKSGKEHSVRITDPRLARVVRRCMEIPGCSLFEYLDHDGHPHVVDSGDVNLYLKEISGHEFTAKDFRTWAGTVTAASLLRAANPSKTQREAKRQITAALALVANELGNTPAVCRKSYIHPAVIRSYETGLIHRFVVLEAGARLPAKAGGSIRVKVKVKVPVRAKASPRPGTDDAHALTADERFAVHLLRSMSDAAADESKRVRPVRAGQRRGAQRAQKKPRSAA